MKIWKIIDFEVKEILKYSFKRLRKGNEYDYTNDESLQNLAIKII